MSPDEEIAATPPLSMERLRTVLKHEWRWMLIIAGMILIAALAACSRDYSYRLKPNPKFCEELGKDCR